MVSGTVAAPTCKQHFTVQCLSEPEPPMPVVVTLPVTNILPQSVVVSRMEEKILTSSNTQRIAEPACFPVTSALRHMVIASPVVSLDNKGIYSQVKCLIKYTNLVIINIYSGRMTREVDGQQTQSVIYSLLNKTPDASRFCK